MIPPMLDLVNCPESLLNNPKLNILHGVYNTNSNAMTHINERLKIDIAGQKFGRLTAIEHVGNSRWRFRCDCGNTHTAGQTAVVNGKQKSCGCYFDEKAENISKIGQNDLYGMRLGSLVAIDRAPKTCRSKQGAYWRCACDCGKEHVARGTSLTSGHSTSCGCKRLNSQFKKNDLTGQVFGRLRVVRQSGSSKQGSIYECACDCGRIVEVRGKDMTTGNTKSCGCLKLEKLSENREKLKRTMSAVFAIMSPG